MEIILMAIAAWANSGAESVCSMEVLSLTRDPSHTTVLARALTDTIARPPDLTGFEESFREPVRGIGSASSAVFGQRFEVIATTGPGGQIGDDATFAVVPWEWNEGCDISPWRASARWVPADTEVVFTLRGSRVEGSTDLVFDVLGWLNPYPSGENWTIAGGQMSRGTSEWLSAREYFALLSSLPIARWYDMDRATLKTTLETLLASPRWSETFPGSLIAERYRLLLTPEM